jgi:hypothetical protein
MLEILLIVSLSRKISTMMRNKGRNPVGYIILFVVLWFGFEILGGIVGAMVSLRNNPRAFEHGIDLMSYLVGLAGAAIGGTAGFFIAYTTPPIQTQNWQADADFTDFQRESPVVRQLEGGLPADQERRLVP